MSSANDNGIGLGLDGLGDLSSLLNPTTQVGSASGPLELSLDLIEEDLNQPRLEDNPGFKPELIAEIGETIKERGVKQPISVRDNPEKPGHYIINDGARRYRASKWLAKKLSLRSSIMILCQTIRLLQIFNVRGTPPEKSQDLLKCVLHQE
jgi:ParB family chromosome partitioning protein